MIEKLLENWLDSAGERTYQAAFVQMLGAQGYRVLHSTRHCALEFGKDVIAIDSDGVPCAFQLKGNPGTRLGLSEFRSTIQVQLVQLISQPIIFPGIDPAARHRSFLVTNGFLDEEVQRAIDDLNRGNYLSKIEVIVRGDLLQWASSLGTTLWPSELEDISTLLSIFLEDGRALLPVAKLATIVEAVFCLRTADKPLTGPQLERACTSAALLTGIAAHRFADADNHFALACSWTLFAVSLIGAHERSGLGISASAAESLRLAEDAIKDALSALWTEIQGREHLVEPPLLADTTEIYRWRIGLLAGLLSTLWTWPGTLAEDAERRAQLAAWLNRGETYNYMLVWGEGVIPCHLAFYWVARRTDPTNLPDNYLANLMQWVVVRNQQDSPNPLADPYYSFEEIGRNIYTPARSHEPGGLREESFVGASYSAELLLNLVAAARLKRPCRVAWPGFSKLDHRRFVPDHSWNFCQVQTEGGTEQSKQYPSEYQWSQLCDDAASSGCAYLPAALAARPHLLLLWTLIAPQRMTTEIGRHLAANLPLHR